VLNGASAAGQRSGAVVKAIGVVKGNAAPDVLGAATVHQAGYRSSRATATIAGAVRG